MDTCQDDEGCDRPAETKGLCHKHYNRLYMREWQRTHKRVREQCATEGCTNTAGYRRAQCMECVKRERKEAAPVVAVVLCTSTEEPCDQPVYAKELCQLHYNRTYKQTYVWANKPEPRPRVKPGSTTETATPCTYQAAHNRVRAVRGKASAHTCECGAPASEWSYRNESEYEQRGQIRYAKRDGTPSMRNARWSPYIWDYDPLCTPCHAARDAHLVMDEQQA